MIKFLIYDISNQTIKLKLYNFLTPIIVYAIILRNESIYYILGLIYVMGLAEFLCVTMSVSKEYFKQVRTFPISSKQFLTYKYIEITTVLIVGVSIICLLFYSVVNDWKTILAVVIGSGMAVILCITVYYCQISEFDDFFKRDNAVGGVLMFICISWAILGSSYFLVYQGAIIISFLVFSLILVALITIGIRVLFQKTLYILDSVDL